MAIRRLAAAMLAAAACSSSIGVAAPCAGFVDVDDSSPFCVNVEWMKNRGITFGLTPTLYDPDSPVTRLQMAAFMYRLGFQNAFLQGGNAFGATAVLGTTDAADLELRVGGMRALTLARSNQPNWIAINVVNGPHNVIPSTVIGGTIAGGGSQLVPTTFWNEVTADHGTIGGGVDNRVIGSHGTVAGGQSNSAAWGGSVGGGNNNTASNFNATVPGGFGNTASGDSSIAMGAHALADQTRCLVFRGWSDNVASGSCVDTPSIARFFANNGLSVDYFMPGPNGRGTRWVDIGGFLAPTIVTWTGAFLSDGGAWTNASDRNAKRGFTAVDPVDVLDRIVALPVARWHYAVEGPEVEHIGPIAQDFRAAFGVGRDDKTISTVDAGGVALAAIQGLNAKLEARLATKESELAALRSALDEIRDAVHRMAGAAR